MTDLQCPSVVLFVPREAIGSAASSGPALGERRLSRVFVAAQGADEPGLAGARAFAGGAACPIEVIAGVVDAASLSEAVEDLSDLHRGETIAVIAASELIRDALGYSNATIRPIEVAIDSSGWREVDPGTRR